MRFSFAYRRDNYLVNNKWKARTCGCREISSRGFREFWSVLASRQVTWFRTTAGSAFGTRGNRVSDPTVIPQPTSVPTRSRPCPECALSRNENPRHLNRMATKTTTFESPRIMGDALRAPGTNNTPGTNSRKIPQAINSNTNFRPCDRITKSRGFQTHSRELATKFDCAECDSAGATAHGSP